MDNRIAEPFRSPKWTSSVQTDTHTDPKVGSKSQPPKRAGPTLDTVLWIEFPMVSSSDQHVPASDSAVLWQCAGWKLTTIGQKSGVRFDEEGGHTNYSPGTNWLVS